MMQLIIALDLMQTNKEPETSKKYAIDSFKIMCLKVKATVLNRLLRVKKELNPKYKALVPEEPSEAKLQGESFQEAIKKLEGTKNNITTSSQNFLGKWGGGGGGGDRNQASQRNRNRFRPYQNQGSETRRTTGPT